MFQIDGGSKHILCSGSENAGWASARVKEICEAIKGLSCQDLSTLSSIFGTRCFLGWKPIVLVFKKVIVEDLVVSVHCA